MRWIATIIMLLLAFSATAQTTPETFTFADRDGWGELKLDCYRPAQQRPDRACVIHAFGGGFVTGARNGEVERAFANALCERGFTVVCIDYRLGLQDSAFVAENGRSIRGAQRLFQHCIDIAAEDCASATAWVVAHAAELGVDPSRIVLTGSSAGAITVLQMDWARCNSLPVAASLPQGWAPMAVIPYSGAIMCKSGKLHYATAPAPTFFLHGTKDKIVAYKRFPPILSPSLNGADKVAKEFKKRNYPHWILRYEGIGHEVASFQMGSIDLFCAFVDQVAHGRQTFMDATVRDSKLVPTKWTDMTVKDLYAK